MTLAQVGWDGRAAAARNMRLLYFICGLICVGVGVAGIFLPLVPTTPLILLAAFCFSKSSERMHRWLTEHRRFGPLIRDWQQHRVIRPRAKLMAVIMIVVVMGLSLTLGSFPIVFKVISAAIGAGVILMICSYPSQPA